MVMLMNWTMNNHLLGGGNPFAIRKLLLQYAGALLDFRGVKLPIYSNDETIPLKYVTNKWVFNLVPCRYAKRG
jgi:hypothetical protein